TGGNLTRLDRKVDLSGYASPHSDIVALMVMAHQTQMQNLIVWLGYETRMALREQTELDRAAGKPKGEWAESTRCRMHNAADELLRYMLVTDEARLRAPVAESSGFAAECAGRGPKCEL